MREAIINLLSKKAGRDVRTPYGSDWLCQDIIATTGERISVNTVKRLTGVLTTGPDSSRIHARGTTLEIIARYLGFADFRTLQQSLEGASSHFRQADGLISISELPAGSTVEIGWEPNRLLTLRRLPSGAMLVEKAANSKLAPGDLLTLSQIMAGYPLLVKEVVRSGQSLGPYTAAPESGLTYVAVNPAPEP